MKTAEELQRIIDIYEHRDAKLRVLLHEEHDKVVKAEWEASGDKSETPWYWHAKTPCAVCKQMAQIAAQRIYE